jgi:glucan biosynthesis protein C
MHFGNALHLALHLARLSARQGEHLMTTKAIQSTGEALLAAPVTITGHAGTAGRLLYIDNVRTFLTALVLLHHIMIVYAGTGSWIYVEGRQDLATTVTGSIFTAVNQAFFMGLFLLISAYFVPGSYDRKGPARFWKERLVRLGIPLTVYSWLVHPLFVYWFLRQTEGLRKPLWEFYGQYFSNGELIGGGPLWFVETLLIFTLVYAMWRLFARRQPAQQPVEGSFPSYRLLALFALGMGVAGFLVRLMFPVGWKFIPLNLQLPFFAQYIFMFVAGLLAYRRGWLASMPDAAGRFWLRVVGLVLLLYVPGALLGGALESDAPFQGGWTWQSLFSSVWEAYLCVGLCTGVLYLFRRYADWQNRLSASLSRSAYAAYIVQLPVITTVALLARDLPYHPLLKFGLVALVAVPLCFGIGDLLRRLPYVSRVL